MKGNKRTMKQKLSNKKSTYQPTHAADDYTITGKQLAKIKNKVARYMVSVISMISASCLFFMIAILVAKAGMRFENFLASLIPIGLILLIIFGYCSEYIKARIGKK